MWHEARKHEKKIRGMMVDYKRRAERRREFYEKIRRDPAQFLQIHGQKAKIHLDATITQAAENSLMPWRGDQMNMIDRFDVRAHLDYIGTDTHNADDKDADTAAEVNERRVNYERWRNLVQNEYLNVSESKALHQIWLEERFGMNQTTTHEAAPQTNAALKRKLAEKKAAIAYNYDKDEDGSNTVSYKKPNESSSSSEESDSDEDYDTAVNIDTLTPEQGIRLSTLSHKYGLKGGDFLKFLEEDKQEAERIRLAKEIENEKSMFSGRKSRRERRALKERRMLILRANNSEENPKPVQQTIKESSSSDSEVEVDEAKIEFITCFGGSSDEEKDEKTKKTKESKSATKKKKDSKVVKTTSPKATAPVVFGPSLPPEYKDNEKTTFNSLSNSSRIYRYRKSRSRSRSRSVSRSGTRSRSRSRSSPTKAPRVIRVKSRSRSRSRERNRHKNSSRGYHRRDRSRSRSRHRSRSRDRRRSPRRRRRSSSRRRRFRSRSRSYNRSQGRTRTRSRSRGRSKRSKDKNSSRTSGNDRRRSRSKSSSRRRLRSRSKSPIGKIISMEIVKDTNLPPETKESCPASTAFSIEDIASISLPDVEPKKVAEPVVVAALPPVNPVKLPSPPIKRYYRHDLARESSSDSDAAESDSVNNEKDNEKSKSVSSLSTSNNKAPSGSVPLKPQERLKKKTQALIEKQFKLDKKAEKAKMEKQEQERYDRDEELKELATKMRYRRDTRRKSYSRSRSVSRSRSRSGSLSRSVSRSRSSSGSSMSLDSN